MSELKVIENELVKEFRTCVQIHKTQEGIHTMNTTDIKSQLFGLINQIEDEEMLLFIIEVIKRLKD